MITFKEKLNTLFDDYNKLITSKNVPLEDGNGILTRYKYPILTAAHTPVFWRYDLDSESNPYLMERIGMNATLNSGAIKWNGKYLLVVRVEGADRKSFFAVAESPNGIDNFRFWDYPITMPEDVIPATLRRMKTAGCTAFSARKDMTRQRRRATCRRQLPLLP